MNGFIQNKKSIILVTKWRIIYETSWPFWNKTVYHHKWGINALKGDGFEKPFGRDGFHYVAAKGIYKGNNIYFAIFMNNYDVNESQVKEYGVASLSPVTSNDTESGKARNRRVEIVKQ